MKARATPSRRARALVNLARGSDPVSTLHPSIFLQLQEEERQRLARALLDGPGQILANSLMEIEYSLPLLEKNAEMAIAGLHALRNELRDGLAQLKNYVAELQPPLLEEMGLGASILDYVRRFSERTLIQADCRGCDQFRERYPTTIEITLFRILQEALTNVHLHSSATHVRVELASPANHVQLSVQDNGRGFALRADNQPKKRQLGLIAMRDRVELLGGQLQLFSEINQGVRLIAKIPYHGNIPEHPRGRSGQKSKTGGKKDHDRTNNTGTQDRRTRTGSGKQDKPGALKRSKNNPK